METQELGGFFKISVPKGCNFVYSGQTSLGWHTFENNGKYDSDIMYISYASTELSSSAPTNSFVEQDGDLTIYKDNSMDIYYVDKVINGHTISIMGYGDLDLLKKVANSIQLI